LKENNNIDDLVRQRTRLINEFYNWNMQVDYHSPKNNNDIGEGSLLKIRVEIEKMNKRNMKHNINSFPVI
jgi:hypothetical protein